MPFISLLLGFVPWRVWVIVAALATGVVGFAYMRHHYIAQGRVEAIDAIKQANDKAAGDAAKGVHDVETCFASGGDWDRANGVCAIPATGK